MNLRFWQRRRNQDLDDEIQAHFRMSVQERMERGQSAAEAEAAARREFGNAGLVKEVTREMWSWNWLERIGQDLRHGLRLLGRSKGFTAVAVLSLALGIGANTAIFSALDALLLKKLPVPHPEQLYGVGINERATTFLAYPTFVKMREVPNVFSGIAAIDTLEQSNIDIQGPGGGIDATPVNVALVSGTYFSMMDVQAIVGRTFTPDDDRIPGGHPVAVISYDYWQRRFNRSPDVVGRSFTLNGITYSILGVTRSRFAGDEIGMPVAVWIPIAMQKQVVDMGGELLSNTTAPWIHVVLRLKPGVAIAQAEAALQLARLHAVQEMQNLTPRMLETQLRNKAMLAPLAKGFSMDRESSAQPLLILMAMVGVILLIACANIANLLLARSTARQREMAIRVAIGAGRSRILGQLLSESFVLAALGGGLGILLGRWGSSALMRFLDLDLDLNPDFRIFAFAGALCLLTGFLFGLAPAIQAARGAVSVSLGGRSGDGMGGGRFAIGKLLVIAQVGLSLVLLVGAGLFARTLRGLKSQDVGFDRQHVLLIWTAPEQEGRHGVSLANLYESAMDRIGALPGVRAVGPFAFGLFGSMAIGQVPHVEGYTPKAQDDGAMVLLSLVAPRFFETVGMNLLLGRDFTLHDRETAPRVAIVNESMAHHYFGDQNPVGKHLGMPRDTGTPIEIVGVVRDAKYMSLRDKNKKVIYFPYRQDLARLLSLCIAVRAEGDLSGVTKSIREELHAIDPNLPITKINSTEDQVDKSLVEERLIAWLSAFFGVVAVLLACLGLYGVMAYKTARRTNEIGVRMALGASSAGVLRMVLKESMWLVLAGVAIGLPVTLATTRLIAAKLFGVSPTDALTFGGAALLLIAVAALAGYLPARRASRVDPMVALRYD